MDQDECHLLKGNMTTCPIDNTIRMIGNKFTIHILRNMTQLNQTRFNQFLGSINGINPKTLSTRLREMERNEIIKRTIIGGVPVTVEYSITEKGKALIPILEQMAAFSIRFCAKDVFMDGKPRTFNEVYEKPPESLL